MLTRSEMEEILTSHYEEIGSDADDAFFATLTDEDLQALFVQAFPDESQRQKLERSIREWTD